MHGKRSRLPNVEDDDVDESLLVVERVCGPELSMSSLPLSTRVCCCWDSSRVVCVDIGRAGTRLPLLPLRRCRGLAAGPGGYSSDCRMDALTGELDIEVSTEGGDSVLS